MDKQPRIRPHERQIMPQENSNWHEARMTALGQLGVEMYHRPNPYIKEYEQKLGQLSLLSRGKDDI
jgi:hypothetical protein